MTPSKTLLLEQFRSDLRCWIVHRARDASRRATLPVDDILGRQMLVKVAIYRSLTDTLGLPPTPDMLLQCGWAGSLIHSVCCETRGMWDAFRTVVAQHHPDIPNPTPLVERGLLLGSIAERFVLQALDRLSGVTSIEVHPTLPGSRREADFQVTAVTGRKVLVEVAMPKSDPSSDTSFLRGYRDRLMKKLTMCRNLGEESVVIWADQLVPPRMLAERMNEVLDRLGLPARPPQSPAWFETALGGEVA